MAVDNFTYQGINRAVSDYSGAKMCEELINLRPTDGGLVPVRPFSVKLANFPYAKLFVHKTTDGDKYLAVKKGTGEVSVYQIEIDDEHGTYSEVKELFSVENITTGKEQYVIDHLYYAAAGNIVLFSVCAPDVVKFGNYAFTWKLDESLTPPAMGYVKTDANAPDIDFEVKDDNTDVGATSDIHGVWQSIAHINYDSSVMECTDSVNSGLNAAQEENQDLCFGTFIIATAFKTKDGNTFWTGNWQIYDPVPTVRAAQDTPYIDDTTRTSSIYDAFFDKYGGFGYEAGGTNGDFLNHIYVYGTKVRMEFDQLDSGSWNKDESIIQSVEIYCSKPQCYLDASSVEPGVGLIEIPGSGNLTDYLLCLPQTKYADMDLGDQLLYHQASINMESLLEAPQTINLTFGGNIQVTEDTLDTDAGALERYGRLLSYNARFHYYDSVAITRVGDLGMPTFNIMPDVTTIDETDVFVRYADSGNNELLYLGIVEDLNFNQHGAYTVIAPSINIKEVITYFYVSGLYFTRTYRMTESSTYNYSICTEGPTETHDDEENGDLEDVKTNSPNRITVYEHDAINVTEQYNPFVFRVEHSYKAPGNVIDVQPQMAGLTDVSYGRDPLSVFTERGVYALTQGSANVLYGAFLPVSNLIGQRGGVPVETGIFFLADGALWLLSGRRVTLISDALSLGPHKYIRNCPGYEKLSGVDSAYDPSSTVTSPVYDVSPYLSQVEFDTFSKGGRLGYNRFRMELFVSNPSYGYTYVLSLKYRQWFKLSQQIWQDEASSDLANTPGSTAGNMNVVDLANEEAGSILCHMQGRPFSMAYQYAHIHRIVAMMRAKLTSANSEVAVAALYGSDDLQNWKLLAYAKRNGSTNPLYISQLRTSSAARSWRYYTICIGGRIPAGGSFHTDIGPVLIDYEPVIRRIG